MAFEEKRAWIMLVISVLAYAAYLAVVLGRAGDTPLAEVSYVPALLWSVGAAIVVSIVLNIVVAMLSPERDKSDERDREINRAGDIIGQSWVGIGGVSALVMAMAELAYFWIANVVYLTFVLSAVFGSVAKIFAYRKGFQSW